VRCEIIEFFRYYGKDGTSCEVIVKDWGGLIRQARGANLLARIAYLLKERDEFYLVPEKPRLHLSNALKIFEANIRSVNWELKDITNVLNDAGVPFVLLKGAAYIVSSCAAAKGRVFGDIDILVSKDLIDKAEVALVHNGWITSSLDAYEQKYYRTWMHEIPPLRNLKRQSVLDVHHTIIPPTSILKPDAKKLWHNLNAVNLKETCYTLSLMDMILHSATHLFYGGEFENGFRDLTDLDMLFNQFDEQHECWETFVGRARELQLELPLYYAVRYTNKMLYTPIPDKVFMMLKSYEPNYLMRKIYDFLYLNALMPNHTSDESIYIGVSRWMLYVRSHWLKMPLYLLVPHLSRKAWMRLTGKETH
jgi:hypothetical protein